MKSKKTNKQEKAQKISSTQNYWGEQLPPFYKTKNLEVSHHNSYSRELFFYHITDLEDITGVPFSKQTREKVWPKDLVILMHLLKNNDYPNEELTPLISDFLSRIVKVGRSKVALKYLDLEILKLTKQVQENSDSGKTTPTTFATTEEQRNFWSIVIWPDNDEDEKKNPMQLFEIDRLHLFRLKKIRKDLFVKQKQNQLQNRGAINSQENIAELGLEVNKTKEVDSEVLVSHITIDPIVSNSEDQTKITPEAGKPRRRVEDKTTYATLFRDPAKGEELKKLLIDNGILDASGKWQINPKRIVVLNTLLLDTELLNIDQKHPLARILRKEFGILPDDLDQTLFDKPLPQTNLVQELEQLISKL